METNIKEEIIKVKKLILFKLKIMLVSVGAIILIMCQTASEEKVNTQFDLNDRIVSVNQYLAEKDKDIIEHYIRRQGWKLKQSSDGYYYEVLDMGSLPKIKKGDAVSYDYTIKLLDGTICYTSAESNPATFVLGNSEEISGMHLAVQRLGKGGKARFIFPPQLAYGLQGDLDKIPQRSVLVYEVKIIDKH